MNALGSAPGQIYQARWVGDTIVHSPFSITLISPPHSPTRSWSWPDTRTTGSCKSLGSNVRPPDCKQAESSLPRRWQASSCVKHCCLLDHDPSSAHSEPHSQSLFCLLIPRQSTPSLVCAKLDVVVVTNVLNASRVCVCVCHFPFFNTTVCAISVGFRLRLQV